MNGIGEPARELRRIAVIGAGLAGRSFSRYLLSRGFEVTLEDVLPSNLREVTAELEAANTVIGRGQLLLVATVEDAVRSADLAIDFVPDELESKLEILSMMDRMAPPGTIFLTPTEVLSISDLSSCTYRPERCLGLSGLSRRDAFTGEGQVRLMHPAAAAVEVLRAAEAFLHALGLETSCTLDPHPSLLAGR